MQIEERKVLIAQTWAETEAIGKKLVPASRIAHFLERLVQPLSALQGAHPHICKFADRMSN